MKTCSFPKIKSLGCKQWFNSLTTFQSHSIIAKLKNWDPIIGVFKHIHKSGALYFNIQYLHTK